MTGCEGACLQQPWGDYHQPACQHSTQHSAAQQAARQHPTGQCGAAQPCREGGECAGPHGGCDGCGCAGCGRAPGSTSVFMSLSDAVEFEHVVIRGLPREHPQLTLLPCSWALNMFCKKQNREETTKPSREGFSHSNSSGWHGPGLLSLMAGSWECRCSRRAGWANCSLAFLLHYFGDRVLCDSGWP